MTGRHHIVVSTENNSYAAWQTKLFHYSCVSRLGQLPIVIVHDSGRDWHTDFHDLIRAGAIVRSAPSYRLSLDDDYPPRNTAGTLLHAANLLRGSDDFIVLCDPDMIFAGRPSFPEILSGDHYPYMMDYNGAEVQRVAAGLGIDLEAPDVQKEELCFGVPYVIPVADARRLGGAWPGLFVSFSLSTVLTFHATFCVNSLCHMFGTRRYDNSDDSRNNWFVALVMLGGGWHNNHHRCPRSARQGILWWEVDVTYYVLRALACFHLIRDIYEPAARTEGAYGEAHDMKRTPLS